MIEVSTLKEMLKTEAGDLKRFNIEQLRLTLGVFRYVVRNLEREINLRSKEMPLGNYFEEVFLLHEDISQRSIRFLKRIY